MIADSENIKKAVVDCLLGHKFLQVTINHKCIDLVTYDILKGEQVRRFGLIMIDYDDLLICANARDIKGEWQVARIDLHDPHSLNQLFDFYYILKPVVINDSSAFDLYLNRQSSKTVG